MITKKFVKKHWPTINLVVYIIFVAALIYSIANFNNLSKDPSTITLNLLKGGLIAAILKMITLAHSALTEVYKK